MAAAANDPSLQTSIFSPESAPADSIKHLSFLVLGITGAIFAVVTGMILYATVRFRQRPDDDGKEPPQVYGSNPVEAAWTIVPILIVVVLALSAARVIQKSKRSPTGVCTRGRRHRAPVVVGIQLSETRHCYGQ